ncbi:cell division cycle 20.5, cofactor of APC complex-like [Cicer arietinum]|uniref:cell division cycle 20.5, cofactor of APC complex-like n=1 Tax=Cicer arietinum TaxID=3827 RepID=UPI003CC5871B
MHSNLHLYDVVTSKLIRKLEGHSEKIAALAWNGNILTSGSHDESIINHDVRARSNVTSQLKGHREAIFLLKWSKRGNMLASGGSESLVYVWESNKMNSSKFLHCFKDHSASVKALAWCPYDSSVLASGGGVDDGCIKLWNVQKGTSICSIDTKAEISRLEWNRHHKEILSGHGFSSIAEHNQLCL